MGDAGKPHDHALAGSCRLEQRPGIALLFAMNQTECLSYRVEISQRYVYGFRPGTAFGD
jgi:hypothetical protein